MRCRAIIVSKSYFFLNAQLLTKKYETTVKRDLRFPPVGIFSILRILQLIRSAYFSEYLCCVLLKTPYRIILSDNVKVCPVLLVYQI